MYLGCLSLVVAGLGSGLVAALPVGPAKPVGRVVDEPGDQRDEHGGRRDVSTDGQVIGSQRLEGHAGDAGRVYLAGRDLNITER